MKICQVCHHRDRRACKTGGGRPCACAGAAGRASGLDASSGRRNKMPRPAILRTRASFLVYASSSARCREVDLLLPWPIRKLLMDSQSAAEAVGLKRCSPDRNRPETVKKFSGFNLSKKTRGRYFMRTRARGGKMQNRGEIQNASGV